MKRARTTMLNWKKATIDSMKFRMLIEKNTKKVMLRRVLRQINKIKKFKQCTTAIKRNSHMIYETKLK